MFFISYILHLPKLWVVYINLLEVRRVAINVFSYDIYGVNVRHESYGVNVRFES